MNGRVVICIEFTSLIESQSREYIIIRGGGLLFVSENLPAEREARLSSDDDRNSAVTRQDGEK